MPMSFAIRCAPRRRTRALGRGHSRTTAGAAQRGKLKSDTLRLDEASVIQSLLTHVDHLFQAERVKLQREAPVALHGPDPTLS